MIRACRFVVSGRVQGVGFRVFVVKAARREGLAGWVCNRADGRVELQAEGEADAIARLERSLWVGPRASRVADVTTEDVAPGADSADFEIR